MFEEIKEAYLRTYSIDDTVKETGINEYKVRRALLTLGLWESERSREIKALLDQGLSKIEIAERLHLSIKGLESYMPYTRGAYLEGDTKDSLASKQYRLRKEEVYNNQVRGYLGGKTRMEERNNVDDIEVYKIQLTMEKIDEEELQVFRKYAKVEQGIIRTILAPSCMQLNRLNYAIQKCFGFYNSHLHHFLLSDEDFERLTHNDIRVWKTYVGTLFRCFFTDGENDDYYYLDDYDGRHSFNTWLKKKYSIPYDYDPLCEQMDVIEGELPYLKNDLAGEDFLYALLECGGLELLERLTIEEVWKHVQQFYYEYDYGDGWRIRIELLEEYDREYASYDETVRHVLHSLAPVCLYVDGLPVIEDVGGTHGFAAFLKGLHGEEDNFHDHVPEDIEWAKSQGWNGRGHRPEKLL